MDEINDIELHEHECDYNLDDAESKWCFGIDFETSIKLLLAW